MSCLVVGALVASKVVALTGLLFILLARPRDQARLSVLEPDHRLIAPDHHFAVPASQHLAHRTYQFSTEAVPPRRGKATVSGWATTLALAMKSPSRFAKAWRAQHEPLAASLRSPYGLTPRDGDTPTLQQTNTHRLSQQVDP